MTELRANMQRNKKYAKQGQYTTVLSPDAEMAFRDWVKQNKVPFNPADNVSDYDMRGFYKALQDNDPRAVSAINPVDNAMHYPDVWKTPYHKSFSNESQWAMPGAPHWMGNKLVTKRGEVVFDEEAQ